jgi:plasmid maintenance system antidote protein VapI
MDNKRQLELLKGLHPGIFLERELKRRAIPMSRFALTVKEYPQTLHAILKRKRSMNTALSLRIEKELGLEEGLLMTLQVFYDIKEEKRKRTEHIRPDLSKIRKVTFWDTELKKIDWNAHRSFVIERIFERGNETERKEIIRLYGQQEVNKQLEKVQTTRKGVKRLLKKKWNGA